jgi:hypothetical protein
MQHRRAPLQGLVSRTLLRADNPGVLKQHVWCTQPHLRSWACIRHADVAVSRSKACCNVTLPSAAFDLRENYLYTSIRRYPGQCESKTSKPLATLRSLAAPVNPCNCAVHYAAANRR